MYSQQRDGDWCHENIESLSVPEDFTYSRVGSASLSTQASVRNDVSLAIYADRPVLRATLIDDLAVTAGPVTRVGSLDDLFHSDVVLADIVMVDCPSIGGRDLAALCHLDMRAAGSGTQLIVSTNAAALDAVFACLDQSKAQILVDPDRAERVLALGRVLASRSKGGVRELSEDDRLMILRLTEQVGKIAGRIESFTPGAPGRGGDGVPQAAFVPSPQTTPPPPGHVSGGGGVSTPALPDARLVRRVIRQRQLRGRFLDATLFADPAWDMLLDLTAARVEGVKVSVTSLCIAASVPPTTALRWIGQMVEAGLFVRTCDDADRRRAFIELSDGCAEAMARYFAEIV